MSKQLPGQAGPIRRLTAVAATAAAAVLLLAGCAAGQDAQTINQQPPIDGASATAGDLSIRTAAIVSSTGNDSYAKDGSALLQLVVVNTGAQTVTLTDVSTPAATGALLSTAGLPQTSAPSDTASATDASSATASSSASASGSAATSPSSGSSATGSASASPSSSPSDTSSAPAAPVSTPIKIGPGQSVQIGYSVVGANVLLQGLTAPLYPAQTVPVTFTFTIGSGSSTVTQTINSDLPVQLASNPPSAPVVSEATEPAEANN